MRASGSDTRQEKACLTRGVADHSEAFWAPVHGKNEEGWPGTKTEYERALEGFEIENFPSTGGIQEDRLGEEVDGIASAPLLYRGDACTLKKRTHFDAARVSAGHDPELRGHTH